MRPFRSTHVVDVALGAAMLAVGILALRPAAPPGVVRAGVPAGGSGAGPLTLPVVVPDTAPADAPLRRELQRLAIVQAAYFEREGEYAAFMDEIAYWPVASATVSLDIDSLGESWTASAYDPAAHRQCAIRVGPAPEPYFRPLEDGVVACRTLPDSGESDLWGRSPPTTVWEDGVGREIREGPEPLRRLRAMQVAWFGDGDEFGRDFIRLRDGLARVPYPDQPGPHWASDDGAVRLADATWGDLDRDGRWEAVIRLVENQGGDEFDGYLALVRERAGRLVNGPLYYLGDRTILLGLRAAAGAVTVDQVEQGDDDPDCCPTDTVEFVLGIRGDSLVEVDAPHDWRIDARRPARPAVVYNVGYSGPARRLAGCPAGPHNGVAAVLPPGATVRPGAPRRSRAAKGRP